MKLSENSEKVMQKFKSQFKNNLEEGLSLKPTNLRDLISPPSDWKNVYTELCDTKEYLEAVGTSLALTKKGYNYLKKLICHMNQNS